MTEEEEFYEKLLDKIRDAKGELANALHMGYAKRPEAEQKYFEAAKERQDDGTLEIDDNAVVSMGADNGAYVDSLGWAFFQLGEFDHARILLERAARLIPDDATVSEHLGDVYASLGVPHKARESYRRALRLDGANKETVRQKLDDLAQPR